MGSLSLGIDAIDNGHNKKAVQMADKILKKQDGLHCAKVCVCLSVCLPVSLATCSLLLSPCLYFHWHVCNESTAPPIPYTSTKALKGIALLRMGRQDEAAPVMDEVLKACPVDQATLQAATMYYRETGECEWTQLVFGMLYGYQHTCTSIISTAVSVARSRLREMPGY